MQQPQVISARPNPEVLDCTVETSSSIYAVKLNSESLIGQNRLKNRLPSRPTSCAENSHSESLKVSELSKITLSSSSTFPSKNSAFQSAPGYQRSRPAQAAKPAPPRLPQKVEFGAQRSLEPSAYSSAVRLLHPEVTFSSDSGLPSHSLLPAANLPKASSLRTRELSEYASPSSSAIGAMAFSTELPKERERSNHEFHSSLVVRATNNPESLKSPKWPISSSPSSSVIPGVISHTLKRKPSESNTTPTLPPDKRRHLSGDQKIITGLRPDVKVEREAIWRNVKSCPFIFIRKFNIEVSENNLYHMGQMVKGASFDAHVRADNTGFFIVFEKSVDGERLAGECWEHFRGAKFYGIPMKMQLYVHGRKERGY